MLNYIPILGPMIGIVTFTLVGLLTADTLWRALLPAGLYLAIHVIEGETVTPMLLARRFTLNPVLIIMAIIFWHWMSGVPGAVLAVPMRNYEDCLRQAFDAGRLRPPQPETLGDGELVVAAWIGGADTSAVIRENSRPAETGPVGTGTGLTSAGYVPHKPFRRFSMSTDETSKPAT